MRYSHAYSIGFDLDSNAEDASDVTPAMLRIALLRRIADIDQNNEWEAAVGGPFDTMETWEE
jgi:hypothetical protein